MKKNTQITNSMWQPIETAPKKWYPLVMLYGKQYSHSKDIDSSGMAGGDGNTYVGCYCPALGRWVNPFMMPKLNAEKHNWVEIEPTHWMPLPSSPDN